MFPDTSAFEFIIQSLILYAVGMEDIRVYYGLIETSRIL